MAVHLVNDPFQAVDEMLAGLLASNADRIAVTSTGRGIYSTVPDANRRIAIVIGGGSGHEPAFFGWVGPGFADAAAVGNIFASPSAETCIEVVRSLDRPEGALFLFGNYEGDIMNFSLATAFLAEEGVRTRTVLITDDVASAPPDQIERRRGVAGGVIVTKIAGALADQGAPLDEIEEIAKKTNVRTRSIGAALSSCHLPTSSKPTFDLPVGQVDFGIGVHGEAGLSRRTFKDANALADDLIDSLLVEVELVGDFEAVVVLVNTFGGTPLLEGFVVLDRVKRRIENAGLTVAFANAGTFLTSLQMAGVSVSISFLDHELKGLFFSAGSALYLPRLGGCTP